MTTKNEKTYTKSYKENGNNMTIKAIACFDDRCKNGHDTFSITGTIFENGRDVAGGCIHDEIAKHFPHLAPLIKWHLVSTDGPMYYIENTTYHALQHGPKKAWVEGHIEQNGIKAKICKYGDITEMQAIVDSLPEGRAELKIDEKTAKVANLEHARSSAVWPEATDGELQLPGLKERLEKRLPKLMEDFQSAVESLGFVYPVK